MSNQFDSFLRDLEARKLPPVKSWQPTYEADLDLSIDHNGQWFYQGTPFERMSLVNLLSGLLVMDDEQRYFLVSPAEKLRINVADVPFIANAVETRGQGRRRSLIFKTNVGDAVLAGADRPLLLRPYHGQSIPYLSVRDGLLARVSRNVYYELVEWADEYDHNARRVFGVWSQNCLFELGEVTW